MYSYIQIYKDNYAHKKCKYYVIKKDLRIVKSKYISLNEVFLQLPYNHKFGNNDSCKINLDMI